MWYLKFALVYETLLHITTTQGLNEKKPSVVMDRATKCIPELDERCLMVGSGRMRLDVKTLVNSPILFQVTLSMVGRGKDN